MGNKVRPEASAVIAALKETGVHLTGERVAILQDAGEETYGDSLIVRPETHEEKPLSGEIVALGPHVSDEYRLEQRVHFNQFSVITFAFDLPDIGRIGLHVLHQADIYWWED